MLLCYCCTLVFLITELTLTTNVFQILQRRQTNNLHGLTFIPQHSNKTRTIPNWNWLHKKITDAFTKDKRIGSRAAGEDGFTSMPYLYSKWDSQNYHNPYSYTQLNSSWKPLLLYPNKTCVLLLHKIARVWPQSFISITTLSENKDNFFAPSPDLCYTLHKNIHSQEVLCFQKL